MYLYYKEILEFAAKPEGFLINSHLFNIEIVNQRVVYK